MRYMNRWGLGRRTLGYVSLFREYDLRFSAAIFQIPRVQTDLQTLYRCAQRIQRFSRELLSRSQQRSLATRGDETNL